MDEPPNVPDERIAEMASAKQVLGIGIMFAGFFRDRGSQGYFELRLADGSAYYLQGEPRQFAVLAKDVNRLVRMTDAAVVEAIRAKEQREHWNQPVPAKPWLRPTAATTGDPHPEMIYMSAGRCLVLWEELEAQLMRLWALFRGLPEDRQETYIDYERLSNAQARIFDIGRAAELFAKKHHDQDVEGKTAALLAEIQKFRPRRNDVAHGVSDCVFVADNPTPNWYLIPARYMVKYYDQNGQPAFQYSSVELNYIAAQFARLKFTLFELVDEAGALVRPSR